MEDALRQVLRRDVALTVAGRTDAGVHALAQVASHEGEPAPARGLNGTLPYDVRVLASEAAPAGFDARRDARSRTYRYRLLTREVASALDRGRVLHWPHALDRERLGACAEALIGTHDFTAFTPTNTEHARLQRNVLRADWIDVAEDILEFRIEADAFLRHMVRTLVGTMLGVAGGRLDIEEFRRLLGGGTRSEAGDTAPAHGLYLESVRY